MIYNPFKRLLGLLPSRDRVAGEVISSADGKVVVEQPGGGRLVVLGEGTVGTNVFVRDGVVEGPAPALTIEVIEVGT